MERIVVQTKITNLFDEDKSIRCGLLVDTGAGALILPSAWKERLGEFKRSETVELQLANQEVLRGEAGWPVEVRIEGFRPISNEVIFVDLGTGDDDEYEPLLGYVILEQAQAAVDMLGHRLVPVRYIDMKQGRPAELKSRGRPPPTPSPAPHPSPRLNAHAHHDYIAAPARLLVRSGPPGRVTMRSRFGADFPAHERSRQRSGAWNRSTCIRGLRCRSRGSTSTPTRSSRSST